MTLIENIEAIEKVLDGNTIDFESFIKNLKNRFISEYQDYVQGSIFRAVVLDEKELPKPLYIDRFSYPNPKKIQVKRGRANIKDYPVLYCSPTLAGAVAESSLSNSLSNKIDKKKRFFVAEWSCKKTPCKIYDLSRRLPDTLPKINSKKIININKIDGEKITNINKYLELIMKCYLSENAYAFSSKWSHFHLYGKKTPVSFDLLKYPSVINNQSINYAIHPDYFDRHYKLKKVYDITLPFGVKPNEEKLLFNLGSVIGIPDINSNKLLFRPTLNEDTHVLK